MARNGPAIRTKVSSICQIFRFDLTSQPALHLRRVHLGLTPDCGVVQGSAIGLSSSPSRRLNTTGLTNISKLQPHLPEAKREFLLEFAGLAKSKYDRLGRR